jgi:hypothetical protein
MKLLDPTGRGNDVKWKKITLQQQKVMKKDAQTQKRSTILLFRGFHLVKLAGVPWTLACAAVPNPCWPGGLGRMGKKNVNTVTHSIE